MLLNSLPLVDDEEDVPYDVESLFINIPTEYFIKHTEQIYKHKKLNLIYSELIFRRLLLKFATDCTYTFTTSTISFIIRLTVKPWGICYLLSVNSSNTHIHIYIHICIYILVYTCIYAYICKYI